MNLLKVILLLILAGAWSLTPIALLGIVDRGYALLNIAFGALYTMIIATLWEKWT